MIYQDDRTPEQRKTHTRIVLMTDSSMSGRGCAAGGPSYVGWACTPDRVDTLRKRAEARSVARRVRVVAGTYRPPSGPGHCHVCVDRGE